MCHLYAIYMHVFLNKILYMNLLQEHQCLKEEVSIFLLRNWQSNRRLLAVRPQLGGEPPAASQLRNWVWKGCYWWQRW